MSVTVQASKHPLKADWVYADVDAGQSIYEIAGGSPVAAYINGREVPEELHRLTKVKDGAVLTLWPVPQDGEILKTVALIAVSIAAPQVAAFALGAGASATALTVATIGIRLAGALAINALIPPQQPEAPATPESFNRLQAITGTSNRVASFQPIPRLYGKFRYFPPIPMTARPFTEIEGDKQYFRMMLCLGYGPIEIGGKKVGKGHSKITQDDSLSGDPIRIGETDISLFEDVEFEIGRPDQMTLYSDQVFESQPAFTTRNSTFDDGGTGTRSDGQFAIRTTEPDTDEISLDIGGRLYSVNDKAKTRNAKVRFKIEYREVGETDFEVADDNFVISSSKKETVREGFRFKVETGQYEVKLTRVSTTHSVATSYANELTWTALRSIRTRKPFLVEDTVVMSLRIKATDQLNGRIEDLSVLATSVLPVYDGTQWTTEATNNPAWAYADLWTGPANRRPLLLSDLDEDDLKDWADFCDSESLEFNHVYDSSGTTLDRAGEIAGAGFATWQFKPDSSVSVVRDIVQSVPKMVISPRNSFDFSFELGAVDTPEGLRVQFVDDRTFENTERLVFDDGFDENSATKFETLQAKGVTNPDQAHKYGRFHLAQQRLRPERYTFSQDVQHLRYQRGDLLTLQHDVISVGIGAGRIKNVVSDTEIELDEVFVDEGKSYGVKIQHQDGSISVVGATPGAGATNTSITLDSAVTKTNSDDLVIFGELGKESIDVKVNQIEPSGDLTAKVSCVPAAPEIDQSFRGAIPAFDPVFTERINPNLVAPRQPGIESINSSEEVMYADDDGSLRVRMLVETVLGSFPGWDQKTQLRFRAVGDSSFETLEPVSSSSQSIFNVDEGVQYEVQARGVKNGLFSPWTSSTIHTVLGKLTPPPNVQVLNAVQNDENVVFRWSRVTVPDIDGYEIRYGPRQTATWASSIKIAEATKSTVSTEADVPPGDFKFFIKAVDTAGNYSRAAATRELLVGTLYEDVRRTVHNPDWTEGEIEGFVRQGTALQLDSDIRAYYKANTVDLGFNAKNVRVWANVGVGQSDIESTEDYGLISDAVIGTEDYGLLTEAVDDIDDYGGILVGLSVSDPSVIYEISSRNEGEDWPNVAETINYRKITAPVTESEDYGLITDEVTEADSYDTLMTWRQWSKGQIDARFVKQRISILPTDQARQGTLLRSFETVVDVPEKIEVLQEKTVDPGGTRFEFEKQFHFKPVVAATVESENDLFAIRKNLDTSGVTFVVRDSNGNDVGADKLDIIARGY